MVTDQRKHVSQMTRNEVNAITGHIARMNVKGLNNPHVRQRKDKWSVSDSEIISAVKYGELIEAHLNNFPDVRFVTRQDNGNRSICVCSNVSGEVITVWVNTVNDNHSTLRLSDYRLRVDLTSVLDTRKG